jgi:hypothetical protein
MQKDINERVQELLAQKLTIGKIRAFLLVEDYSSKAIKLATSNLSATPSGLKAKFYTFLLEGERTEKEVLEFIASLDSSNALSKKSAYISVAKLAQDIRNLSKGGDDRSAFDLAKASAYKLVEELSAKLDSLKPSECAKFKRDYRTKAHPDKVAHFRDAKLTALYNELSKLINNL